MCVSDHLLISGPTCSGVTELRGEGLDVLVFHVFRFTAEGALTCNLDRLGVLDNTRECIGVVVQALRRVAPIGGRAGGVRSCRVGRAGPRFGAGVTVARRRAHAPPRR
jgi:hypothetical protein